MVGLILKIHCNGCDDVIAPFHSRLRLYAGMWKGDTGDDSGDPVDVCDECARKNPLLHRAGRSVGAEGEDKAMMYYIENIRQGTDCCIWWRIDGKGYTRILDEAWLVDEAKARQVCSSRPEQDVMRLASEVEALAVRHVPR